MINSINKTGSHNLIRKRGREKGVEAV